MSEFRCEACDIQLRADNSSTQDPLHVCAECAKDYRWTSDSAADDEREPTDDEVQAGIDELAYDIRKEDQAWEDE